MNRGGNACAFWGLSPPRADILVILNPAAGPMALKTTVRISGDPVRADALLKATTR